MITIQVKFFIISALLLFALISDLSTYKIKNSITYSFMLAGLTANTAVEGSKGALLSLQGIILPVACLAALYAIRVIGAGDIKLLSAIGAIMGAGFAFDAVLYSFICGGFIATVIILARRNGSARFRHLLLYIKSCLISFELLQYADFKDKQDGGRFHFSIAIAAGTVTAIIMRGTALQIF